MGCGSAAMDCEAASGWIGGYSIAILFIYNLLSSPS
jgi:hypothetical protein